MRPPSLTEILRQAIEAVLVILKIIWQAILYILSLIWTAVSGFFMGSYDYLLHGNEARLEAGGKALAILVFIIIVTVALKDIIFRVLQGSHTGGGWTPTPPRPRPRPQPMPGPRPNPNYGIPLGPHEYLHGTSSLNNALDIYRTNTWLIGKNTSSENPKGIYVTKSLDYAKDYAKTSGAIIK